MIEFSEETVKAYERQGEIVPLMTLEMFQGYINAIIKGVHTLKSLDYKGDLKVAAREYLLGVGLQPHEKDLDQIVVRAMMLFNEPEHKCLLGKKPPEGWIDPQVAYLVEKYKM